jgi:O-antigen ligase
LVILAFSSHVSGSFPVPKYTVLLVGGLAVGGITVVEAARRRSFSVWASGLHWPVLALFIWGLVAALSGSNPRLSLHGQYPSLDGVAAAAGAVLLFFGAAEAFKEGRSVRMFSALYLVTGGLVGLYGLVQMHDQAFSGPNWDPWGGGTTKAFESGLIYSTLGNPNHLAALIAMLLPIGACIVKLHRDPRLRWPVVGLSGVLLIELLVTASRGAWLAAVVGMVVFGAVLLPARGDRRRLFRNLAFGAGAVTFTSAVMLGASSGLRHRVALKLQLSGSNTVGQRFELWRTAWRMAGKRPLAGWGPDTFRFLFPAFETHRFASLYGSDQSFAGPHNVFLNYLYSEGWPGLLLFLSVLVVAALRVVAAARILRRKMASANRREATAASEQLCLVVAAAASVAAYVVQAAFNLQFVALTAWFWTLLGVLAALTVAAGVPVSLSPRRLFAVEPEEATARPSVRPRRAAGENGVIVVAAVAFVWLIGSWFATNLYRAAREATQAKHLQSADIAAASRHYRAAVRADPWAYVFWGDRAAYEDAVATQVAPQPGSGLDQRTWLLQARNSYAHEVALAPRSAAALDGYATVLLHLKELEHPGAPIDARALTLLRKAVRLEPWNPEPLLELTTALAEHGRTDEALALVDRALARTPREPKLLRGAALLYERSGRPADARALWSRLLRILPKDEEARRHLTPSG